MTEEEWLTCTDYQEMEAAYSGGVSVRQVRLFSVASCRKVWRLYRRDSVREAILVGERYADGLATDDELRAALRAIHAGRAAQPHLSPQGLAHQAAGFVAAPSAWSWAGTYGAAGNVITALALEVTEEKRSLFIINKHCEWCSLVRDIFGNPFRPVPLDSAWLNNNVVALALGIYSDHAFDAMPILADALEDAGCVNLDLLAHCRNREEHYRGCWALDLLLGKEEEMKAGRGS